MQSLSILFGTLAVFYLSASSSCSLTVSAFSFSDLVSKQADRYGAKRQSKIGIATTTTTTTLGVTTTTRSNNGLSEENAQYIFNKAREYAFRDDFSRGEGGDDSYDKHYHSLNDEKAEIEESKFWLREIIHLQSGCVAGTLSGKDVCENQAQAAEIVGHLRRKIEIHEKRVALRTKGSDSPVPTIATNLISVALLLVVVIFWTTVDVGQRHDDVPSLDNYNHWLSVLKEKGYVFSLMGGGSV